MDRAQLNNAPREITLGGTVYLASELKEKEWGAVQAWIKDHVPGPLAVLDPVIMERLPSNQRKELMQVALIEQRNWPPRIASPVWWDALDHPGGWPMFFKTVLGKHQEVPDSRFEELEDILTRQDVIDLAFLALGIEDRRPKAAAAIGTEDPPIAPTSTPIEPTT